MTTGWQQLFQITCRLIDQVNEQRNLIDYWTLGGGTALMLQIGHRDSHDVDIFLDDPQLLPFLDPAKCDFKFAIEPSAYQSDGTGSLKIVFEGLGEIDFIASATMTNQPVIMKEILGRRTMLETIPEIIAKKVFYRGAMITPRDIFDIAAAARDHRASIVTSLREYKPKVERTIKQIKHSSSRYVYDTISKLQIHGDFERLKANAVDISLDVLEQALA
jgi:hypothetical protein